VVLDVVAGPAAAWIAMPLNMVLPGTADMGDLIMKANGRFPSAAFDRGAPGMSCVSPQGGAAFWSQAKNGIYQATFNDDSGEPTQAYYQPNGCPISALPYKVANYGEQTLNVYTKYKSGSGPFDTQAGLSVMSIDEYDPKKPWPKAGGGVGGMACYRVADSKCPAGAAYVRNPSLCFQGTYRCDQSRKAEEALIKECYSLKQRGACGRQVCPYDRATQRKVYNECAKDYGFATINVAEPPKPSAQQDAWQSCARQHSCSAQRPPMTGAQCSRYQEAKCGPRP
jgi:hypothetical protein